ncbi:site-2 protease family protein [bacterium]|nr:site-2 protease family protein [bacterium]
MAEATEQRQLAALVRMVADLFVIDATYRRGPRFELALRPRFDRKRTIAALSDRLDSAGYTFEIRESDESITLLADPVRKLKIPRLNIILFVLTVLSVYIVPVVFRSYPTAVSWDDLWQSVLDDLAAGRGLVFTAALMSILLVHEMGHFIASRRRDIVTSWPYFLPAPNIIGSFGAVIKSKSPFWNRRDLIEVGAAGPIAGWIVAIVWLLIGLSQSAMIPNRPPFPPDAAMPFFLDGESILIKGLVPILIGQAPEGYVYGFTEAAFAGWVGLLVTAINMLPIGQLDGGHIVYGLFGRDIQRKLAWAALLMLAILGYYSIMWWLFAGLGLIFGAAHPPTLNDSFPTSKASRIMGIAALIILLLSFTPIPFPSPW